MRTFVSPRGHVISSISFIVFVYYFFTGIANDVVSEKRCQFGLSNEISRNLELQFVGVSILSKIASAIRTRKALKGG